ncbi:hypothetical protein ACXZ65_24645 [Streptomyces aculeolatus]
MAKNSADVRLLTTDLPLQGERISFSWMIWSAEEDSVWNAMGALQMHAARGDADAVLGIRVVAQARLHVGVLSGQRYDPKYTAYGTAVRFG